MVWVVKARRGLFTLGKKQAWWIPGSVWTDAEILATTGIPSTDSSCIISKAETKIKILKFNAIVFKSRSNPFWMRVASKC
jgi:hypothetical protein